MNIKIPLILISALLSVIFAVGIISGAGFGLFNDKADQIRSINSEITTTIDNEGSRIRNMSQMDVYIKDAAKDVRDYIRSGVSEEKEQFYKNTQSSRALLDLYKDSGNDVEEARLIDKLATQLTDFEGAGNQLIATQDAQTKNTQDRDRLVNDKIEPIFDDLKKNLNSSEPDFAKKQVALVEMETSLNKILSYSMAYLVKPETPLKDRVDEDSRDLRQWTNQFSQTQLTSDESIHSAALKRHFKSLEMLTQKAVALEDKQIELLAEFEEYEKKLNHTLADELVPMAVGKISEVQGGAIHKINNVLGNATSAAEQRLIAMGVVVISATILGLMISHSISNPIAKLRGAFNEITKGNFDVKVKPQGNTEISSLYKAFNSMVDKLIDKDKLQKEFISVASHELRSPIQPILSYAELAKKGQVSSEQAWTSVLAQARRLQRLANDILYVTRIEAGDLTYAMRKVTLNEVITDVVNAEKMNLSEGVSMDLTLDQDVEIYADTNRLTQALTNIIGNAVKFSKKGYIKVETHVLSRKKNIEIRISDTAGGIHSDILPKLFGKFVTKSIGSEVKHGTGLGLYISKAIITAHRGEISAYNNEEGGATFVMVLPIESIKHN